MDRFGGLRVTLVSLCVALLLGATGCGAGAAGNAASSKTGAGSSSGAAAAPTTLPAGATLGCDETPQPACTYGGATAAPHGVKVEQINTQITPGMMQVQSPLAVVSDKSAPGGEYIALPQGTGSTSATNGLATMAVNIPQTGYYIMWAATQSGDTTTGTDSFFLGLGLNNLPTADLDHTWSIMPDNNWHVHDSTGGCVQLVHSGPNDAPSGCDTWHFQKGILVIYIAGRETNSHLAWLEISPANPKNPLPDTRQ